MEKSVLQIRGSLNILFNIRQRAHTREILVVVMESRQETPSPPSTYSNISLNLMILNHFLSHPKFLYLLFLFFRTLQVIY